ncbi:unnamed protein product [Rhizoctonia solani]|uniref:BTB domain-containing protein n=1 Tax=Rhizoctonia solani TaxID=456999 RepID=A0A8H3H2X4_9AGAM|nr:unnamed protein product [Rhizoctonia solani]
MVEVVAASDFVSLLKVLYESYFSSNRPTHETCLIVPAFRLACVFNFSDLRAHLLLLAEEMLGDADKILFAREFKIKEWLAPAYIPFVNNSNPSMPKRQESLGSRVLSCCGTCARNTGIGLHRLLPANITATGALV